MTGGARLSGEGRGGMKGVLAVSGDSNSILS